MMPKMTKKNCFSYILSLSTKVIWMIKQDVNVLGYTETEAISTAKTILKTEPLVSLYDARKTIPQ